MEGEGAVQEGEGGTAETAVVAGDGAEEVVAMVEAVGVEEEELVVVEDVVQGELTVLQLQGKEM